MATTRKGRKKPAARGKAKHAGRARAAQGKRVKAVAATAAKKRGARKRSVAAVAPFVELAVPELAVPTATVRGEVPAGGA